MVPGPLVRIRESRVRLRCGGINSRTSRALQQIFVAGASFGGVRAAYQVADAGEVNCFPCEINILIIIEPRNTCPPDGYCQLSSGGFLM